MIKEEAERAAVKLLNIVYADNINAVAAIQVADAEFRGNGEAKEIINALQGVKEFVSDLIYDLINGEETVKVS